LEIWQGNEENVTAAQKALYHRALCNRAARRGEYNASKDNDGLRGGINNAAPELNERGF
jgi:fructose-bisphosphate aldolase class I